MYWFVGQEWPCDYYKNSIDVITSTSEGLPKQDVVIHNPLLLAGGYTRNIVDSLLQKVTHNRKCT